MKMINLRVRTFISTGDKHPDPQTWAEDFTVEELCTAFENIEIEEHDSTWWKLCKTVKKAFGMKGYDVAERTIMVIKSNIALVKVGKAVGLDYASEIRAKDEAFEKRLNSGYRHPTYY